MTSHIKYWKCPNCGQVHFSDEPPDTCDYCQDFTTWRLLQFGGNVDHGQDVNKTDADNTDNNTPSQRSFFDD